MSPHLVMDKERGFSPPLPTFVVGLMYGFFIFLFVGCMSGSLFDFIGYQMEMQKNGAWSTTQGKVADTKFYKLKKGRSDGYDYIWQVDYSYKLDGKNYSSGRDTLAMGGHFGFDPKLNKGDSVTVYYQPTAPTNAVLDTAVPLPDNMTLYVSFAFCMGLGLFIEWGGRHFNYQAPKTRHWD